MSNASDRLARLLTVDEVAEHLHVCSRTVRRILGKGDLPFHQIGNQIRVAEPDLGAYLAQRRK